MKLPVALLSLAVAFVCAGQVVIKPAPSKASGQIAPAANAKAPNVEVKPPASTAPAPASAVAPRVSPQILAQLEQGFEDKVRALKGEEPFNLLGASAGFYLEGYGVVVTVPLDLINTPGITPMRLQFSKQDQEQVHRRKAAQLPALRQAAREMVASAAASLSTLPMDRKISVALRIYYMAWEDSSGLPHQIVATADRKSAQAGAIQLEEQ
jgi:hypothetical protein